MKYFVIAKKWFNERLGSDEYIAGEFDDYANARIFCKAYNEHYSTDAKIYSENEILNRK